MKHQVKEISMQTILSFLWLYLPAPVISLVLMLQVPFIFLIAGLRYSNKQCG